MTDFSLLLPNIFDDNTRADKERMKRMILRLQNLQSFYYYHSEKSFVSVSFHPLSIHPCFVTKQRWAQFCVKDVKGEKRLENLWPKCPPTKPPTSHFVHVEIQRYHLLEGFETRTWLQTHICPHTHLKDIHFLTSSHHLLSCSSNILMSVLGQILMSKPTMNLLGTTLGCPANPPSI